MPTAAPTLERSLTVRLPVELHSKLEQLAKATGRTKSFYAVEALQEYKKPGSGSRGQVFQYHISDAKTL